MTNACSLFVSSAGKVRKDYVKTTAFESISSHRKS